MDDTRGLAITSVGGANKEALLADVGPIENGIAVAAGVGGRLGIKVMKRRRVGLEVLAGHKRTPPLVPALADGAA